VLTVFVVLDEPTYRGRDRDARVTIVLFGPSDRRKGKTYRAECNKVYNFLLQGMSSSQEPCPGAIKPPPRDWLAL
jgi:hypothetical protein